MTSPISGYYRFPAIHQETIVFVAEDDLWEVAAEGGVARRLTTNLSTVAHPYFSPDGQWIAFSGAEEGPQEVCVMPATGGPLQRLTFLGAMTFVVGWDGDKPLFASTAGQALRHPPWLHQISLDGSDLERLNLGPANYIAKRNGIVVLGRRGGEPAKWKRYRGGTTGELWIDPDGQGEFRQLIELDGNPADPMLIGDRVYFLSDHEGIGNLFSCTFDGSDLRVHSNQTDFYARNASTDGSRIVYHAGADLYILDPETDGVSRVGIEFHGARTQASRKFVDVADSLEDYDPSPGGDSLALICRGKSFVMGCWELAPSQQGSRQETRYRFARILNDGERVVVCSDARGREHLEIFSKIPQTENADEPRGTIDDEQLGRPMAMEVSPVADTVLIVNHRNELLHVDLESDQVTLVDRSEFGPMRGFAWSPDGRWAAYGCSVNPRQSVIKLWNRESNESHAITRPILHDGRPVFDPAGRYLYFLSHRVFDPVYDSLNFDLGFPRGVRPYMVALNREAPSPFVPEPESFHKSESKEEETGDGKPDEESGADPESNELKIDFEGIEDRVVAFPVSDGIYGDIGATKNRVFYTDFPVKGSLDHSWFDKTLPAEATLKYYDLKKREEKTFTSGISNFKVSRKGDALAIRAGNRLRVVSADRENLDEKKASDEKPGRTSGWIDLARLKLSIDPPAEWRQMLKEAWRLQRDYFWSSDMSGVDWQKALDRYLPLIDRVASRHEFADLIWEMQGELGTSHAYELGGDYRKGPNYRQGFLGADFRFDSEAKAWRIEHIVEGDTWDEKNAPPLLRPGVNVEAGMRLLAVGSERLDRKTPPGKGLVHQSSVEVALTIADRDGANPRVVHIKTLRHEALLRYRDWVERNREFTHERSQGKVGYLHIPDMGPFGYSEFHRYFVVELDCEGLVVDVRYNGGGHVSQLLLEKLARRRIGYDLTPWMGSEPYPSEAPQGPMVCLTNEYAGSDGDIVSHSFKLMKLGALIGKRTWGGVIGIWPRNSLVDGSTTTQPEFSFWFRDVGFGVENYGTDPDIEIDIAPQDWAAGVDPQLERAIEEAAKEIEANPPLKPDFDERPNLRYP